MIEPRTSPASFVYQVFLGVASGVALGFFGWIVADRMTDAAQPAWPYLVAGAILMTVIVRALAARKGSRRWIHLLWIPVAVFALLMAMVIMALRNCT
jgi:cell division protein FtsW (lipid II flippase)